MLCHLKRSVIVVLIGGMCGCANNPTFGEKPTSPGPSSVGLWVTSEGVTTSAQKGNNELSEYNDAAIVMFIQNAKTGHGVTSIAPLGHTGNSRSGISLPDGWNLSTAKVPGGGCELKPTHLYNDGLGGYTLSVMTMSIYGPCPWLNGEYAYRLSIDNGILAGGTVGKIVIE